MVVQDTLSFGLIIFSFCSEVHEGVTASKQILSYPVTTGTPTHISTSLQIVPLFSLTLKGSEDHKMIVHHSPGLKVITSLVDRFGFPPFSSKAREGG